MCSHKYGWHVHSADLVTALSARCNNCGNLFPITSSERDTEILRWRRSWPVKPLENCSCAGRLPTQKLALSKDIRMFDWFKEPSLEHDPETSPPAARTVQGWTAIYAWIIRAASTLTRLRVLPK